MADLALIVEVEKITENAVSREGPDRQWRYELARSLRHNTPHRNAVLACPADQFQALVGGNAAADNEKYAVSMGFHEARDRRVCSRILSRGETRRVNVEGLTKLQITGWTRLLGRQHAGFAKM
jgi:hypothetical protein